MQKIAVALAMLSLFLLDMGAVAQKIETRSASSGPSAAPAIAAPKVSPAAPAPVHAAPTQSAAPVSSALQAHPSASGGGDPPDKSREAHEHAHARLCDKQKCDVYCEAKERNVWANERSFVLAKRECMQYCWQDCD